MALVFQYGSNCSQSQMNGEARLRGDAVFVDTAETVDDYHLSFDVWSKNRGCAAANIMPCEGEKVWGVIYEVPDWLMSRDSAKERGRKSFDAIEGEGKNYCRIELPVRRSNGDVITALTYVVQDPKDFLKTSTEYVSYVVTGLRERGIDPNYIERVKEIAAQNNAEIAEAVSRL
jgi:cation transport regulator ChaC